MGRKKGQSNPGKSKHVLAVRMLATRVAWLDGRPQWLDGQIVWRTESGDATPGVFLFAQAQRSLHKISQYPRASRIAFGDIDAWFTQKQSQLELAKRLHALPMLDLERLVESTARRDTSSIPPLVSLLVAEALCAGELPYSPSRALVLLGDLSITPLRALFAAPDAPEAACALAGLVLGAIERHGFVTARPCKTDGEDWRDRCFAWGLAHGLTDDTSLILALLEPPDGKTLARRCFAALQSSSAFHCTIAQVRGWVASGKSPTQAVIMAEVASEACALERQMLDVKDDLPDHEFPQQRLETFEMLHAERQEAVDEIAGLFHQCLDTHGAEAGRLFLQAAGSLYSLSRTLLNRSEVFAMLHTSARRVLIAGLELGDDITPAYLALLVEQSEELWLFRVMPQGKNARTVKYRFDLWLGERRDVVMDCRKLLAASRDKTVVARALALDDGAIGYLSAVASLSREEWTDPQQYRVAISLMEWISPCEKGARYDCVTTLIGWRASARDAIRALYPIRNALEAYSPKTRRHVLELLETLEDVPTPQDRLQQMTRFLPTLAAFADEHAELCDCCSPLIAYLAEMEKSDLELTERRLRWGLDFIAAHMKSRHEDYGSYEAFRLGVRMAKTLNPKGETAFQDIVQTAMAHKFDHSYYELTDGLDRVQPGSSLAAALAQSFPRQPQRCADLLARLGMTQRLGPEVTAQIKGMEPQQEWDGEAGSAFPVVLCADASWRRLLQAAPELAPTMNAYLHARWLLGEATTVPPGVRRALDRRDRLIAEWEYASQKPELSARAKKIGALLSDTEGLQTEIAAEASERLAHVNAEAQIEMAEKWIVDRYRRRLESVLGPLPDGLEFASDLINATILTANISFNKKLLRNLLRAQLSGDKEWRDRHPANQKFLATMRSKGVEIDVWTSEFPRELACPDIPGEKLCLSMELDPLQILQMGNYVGTCLSVGGANSFSTVANACEWNKRVIYARDGAGRVVGRKLIGVTEDWTLVGFHGYARMEDDQGSAALRVAMEDYAREFAHACGLALANEGTIPMLFAENWYDGVVAWGAAGDDEEEEAGNAYLTTEASRQASSRKSPPAHACTPSMTRVIKAAALGSISRLRMEANPSEPSRLVRSGPASERPSV